MVTVELRKLNDADTPMEGAVKGMYKLFVESPEIEKMLAEGGLFGYFCDFVDGVYVFAFCSSSFSEVIDTFTNHFDEFFRTHEGRYF